MPAEELPEIFAFFDTIGDGKVYVDQLGNVLRAAGLTPTEAILETMSKPWAGNKEVRLTVEDVKPIYSNVKKEMGNDVLFETMHACLSHYDREGNGTISHADLRHLLVSSGEKMSEREADLVTSSFFVPDGNNVDITEFVKHIQAL
ncbi:unnamed protein product, partial [Mesorhabditis spiculigera]